MARVACAADLAPPRPRSRRSTHGCGTQADRARLQPHARRTSHMSSSVELTAGRAGQPRFGYGECVLLLDSRAALGTLLFAFANRFLPHRPQLISFLLSATALIIETNRHVFAHELEACLVRTPRRHGSGLDLTP